jgi:CDP-diacylglycerol---glycerol-3-phosphate 3-phosphatidyltransferase
VVSVSRVLLIPLLVVLIAAQHRTASYAAAVVFAVGALTDGVDGYLARRFATVTRTGQWLDPLADKLFVSAAVVTLTVLGEFPVWAAVIVVARELTISALRAYQGLRGRPMPATPAAKLKTTLQLAAITLYILPLGSGAHAVRLWVLVAAVLLTVVTGADYLVRAYRLQRGSSAP